jgi:Flp pilus assembly protein TadG
MTKTRLARQKQRRGLAAVELAVTFPLLLVILAGTWEVGRLVEVHQLVANAAREAGRQASLGDKTIDEVADVAKAYLARSGLPTSEVTVLVSNLTEPSVADPSDATQLDQLKITVSLPFDNLRWIMLDRITSVSEVSATSIWSSMKDLPVVVSTSIPVE